MCTRDLYHVLHSCRRAGLSHDVAQVSIPIQQARASAWTALRSSRSIVVLLMLFQPEHDVGSWHETDMPRCPLNGRYRGKADVARIAHFGSDRPEADTGPSPTASRHALMR